MTKSLSVLLPGLEDRSDHIVVFAPEHDQVALWADGVIIAGLTEGAKKQVQHLSTSLTDQTQTVGISLPAVDTEGSYAVVCDPAKDQLTVYGLDGDTPLAATDEARSAIEHLTRRS